MSAIRERTTLCVVDLPKVLTSRRNFLAHFMKYGDIKSQVINKDLRSAIIKYATHFEAQTAKTQGGVYDGKPLKIFWSESSTLDPRAKEDQDSTSNDNDEFWTEDDKECFGVESRHTKDERKQNSKDMIKQHLKLSGIKGRITLAVKTGEEQVGKESTSHKSNVKPSKMFSKSSVLKKSMLSTIMKRKVVRRDEGNLHSISRKPKALIKDVTDQKLKASNNNRPDFKQKLALLDERDKLIRKGIVQNSNIKTAVAIKGTCPDMCPERERILRQWGHAVATYELIPGTNEMDENRAVKEYIRSSADQEEPLPHDLRPIPVLSMTMNYLITQIITRVDNDNENKAIWYSFCWNRLRSIRKDIILQQLCDTETVTIVEQCARFHICCYDHMWGAEVSGFDDKMNTQNLLHCLQTLKHMYEDLAKHGVSCPNEAEFYSYLILIEMKSGDIMWEYQHYPVNIRLSPEVQFAIKAYMAFKNNMYSRYFSLVSKASYLTACLMQCCFQQVRSKALKTMLKAYGLPNKSLGLSSSFIVSSLKFDSPKNAMRFCEEEEVDVKFDSDASEDDIFVSTSSYLIREKRLPIANAVVGVNNPIPQFIPHEVQSSFDEFGKLVIAPTVESVKIDEPSNLTEEIPITEEKNSVFITNQVDTETFKFSLSPTKIPENMFGNALFSSEVPFNSNIKSNNFEVVDGITKSSDEIDTSPISASEIEHDFVEDMICDDSEFHKVPYNSGPNISQQVLMPVDNVISKCDLVSFASMNKSNTISERENDILKEKTHYSSPLSLIRDSGASGIEQKQTAGLLFTFPSNVPKEVNSGTIMDDLNKYTPKEHGSGFEGEHLEPNKQIVSESVLPDVNKKQLSSKEPLQAAFNNNKDTQLANEKEFRALLLEKLLKEKAEQEKLEFEEKQRLEKIKKKNEEQNYYRFLKKDVSKRCKVISARKCAREWRMKIEKVKKTRADFPQLFQLSVKDHLSKWGSINSIPTKGIFSRAKAKRNTVRIISELLNSGVTNSCKYLGDDLAETLAKSASKTMKKGMVKPIYWKLAFSLPCSNNTTSTLSVFNQLMRQWCRESFYKEEHACLGSVERVITSLEIPVSMSVHLSDTLQSNHDLQGMDALVFVVLNDTETGKTCVQRLRSLLSSQITYSDFSIVVMNVGGTKMDKILETELQKLQEQNEVAHWKICNWTNPKAVIDGLHFLANQVDVVPHICASSLEVLVRQVSEEFFDALSCSQHSSEALASALKNPNVVINLYNICLTKLEDMLKSSKLEKYFNFPVEFKPHIPMNESGGPELLCGKNYDDIYKCQLTKLINCLKLPELSRWPAKSTNRLVKVLKTYCNEVDDNHIFPQIIRMLDLPDEVDLQQHLQRVSWLDIVEIWAQCKIRSMLSTNDKSKRLFVVFNKIDVHRLIQKQWWLKLPIVVEQK